MQNAGHVHAAKHTKCTIFHMCVPPPLFACMQVNETSIPELVDMYMVPDAPDGIFGTAGAAGGGAAAKRPSSQQQQRGKVGPCIECMHTCGVCSHVVGRACMAQGTRLHSPHAAVHASSY